MKNRMNGHFSAIHPVLFIIFYHSSLNFLQIFFNCRDQYIHIIIFCQKNSVSFTILSMDLLFPRNVKYSLTVNFLPYRRLPGLYKRPYAELQ